MEKKKLLTFLGFILAVVCYCIFDSICLTSESKTTHMNGNSLPPSQLILSPFSLSPLMLGKDKGDHEELGTAEGQLPHEVVEQHDKVKMPSTHPRNSEHGLEKLNSGSYVNMARFQPTISLFKKQQDKNSIQDIQEDNAQPIWFWDVKSNLSSFQTTPECQITWKQNVEKLAASMSQSEPVASGLKELNLYYSSDKTYFVVNVKKNSELLDYYTIQIISFGTAYFSNPVPLDHNLSSELNDGYLNSSASNLSNNLEAMDKILRTHGITYDTQSAKFAYAQNLEFEVFGTTLVKAKIPVNPCFVTFEPES